MPGWRDFPVQDLSALAQVVRGFHLAQPEPALPQDVLDLGSRVYAAHCAQCHGENGAGDGSTATQFPDRADEFPYLASDLGRQPSGA